MEQRRINRNSKTRFFPDSAGKKWFACWRTASSGIYRFMSTPDDFSTYVADLLSGPYDCVDRIAVRGYFPLGQTSGGLLTWWNRLFPNTQLSEQRLRKLVGDFARRVHAYARKHKIRCVTLLSWTKPSTPKPRNFAPPIPSSEGCLPFSLPKLRPWFGKPKIIATAKWCCDGPKTGGWSITTISTLSTRSGDTSPLK